MNLPEISKLKELDFQKQLTFAFLTCKRLSPNYFHFSINYKFGNADIIKDSIEYIQNTLFEKQIEKQKIYSLIKLIDKNIPDPSNYDTVLASSALDACTAIIESLNFIIDNNVSRLYDISTMAIDTIDMYIQETENLDYNTDTFFQKKIDTHPLMKREVALQKGIINYLNKSKSIDSEDIQTLLSLQENDNKGSLSL